jgi:PKD repeat protein
MKQKFIYALLLLLLFACEKEEEVTAPVARFTVSSNEVSVNETVTFEYTGSGAKQVAVYTGDQGHDYSLKTSGNSGLVVNKGILTYSYKKPGRYTAVLVASNYDKEGKDIVFAVDSTIITVEDDRTDLRVISLKKDIYNKEIPGQIIDRRILFAIPYKVRVSGRDVAVNIAQQRLEIAAFSDAATVLVNDETFGATTRYNLSNPLSVKIVSAAGDEKEYEAVTLRYPIFESFSINGAAGTVQYSDFDFDKLSVTVTLPAGTNPASLVPVFASNDAQTVHIGETAQVSGETAIDFTHPVTYRLKTWKPEAESTLFCETEVEVKVIIE